MLVRVLACALGVLTATVGLAPTVASAASAADVVCSVSGQVTAGADPAPAGVGVRFTTENGDATTSTDESGAFSFDVPCGAGTLAIGSSGEALLPVPVTVSGPATAEPGTVWDVRLPAPVRVGLTVTDEAGAPQPGVVVRQSEDPTVEADPVTVLPGGQPFRVVEQLEDVVTDDRGAVTFTTYPMAQMDLTLVPPAGSPLLGTRTTIPATASGEHTVALAPVPPPANLTGHLVDHDRAPVPGVHVGVSTPGGSDRTDTDADGGFALRVPRGKGTLSLSSLDPAVDRGFYSDGIPLTVGDQTDVTAVLPERHQHHVTVLDNAGRPAPGAVLERADGEPFDSDAQAVLAGGAPVSFHTYVSTVSDESGVATFSLFPQARIGGLVARWRDSAGRVLTASVPRLDGRTDSDTTVTLPAPPTDNAVTGTVRLSDGTPVPGVDVYLGGGSATTDASGSYALVSDGGSQSLGLSVGVGEDSGPAPAAGLPASFSLGADVQVTGDMALDLTLPAAATVTVRVTDPTTGGPVPGTRIGSGDTEPFRVTGVDLGDGLTANGDVYVVGSPTDEDGRTSFRTWPVAALPQVRLTGPSGPLRLSATLRRLEVTGDKQLDVALGTTSEPAIYTPPAVAEGVTALPASESASRAAARARTSAVAVSWRHPKRDGGLPIAGYRVVAQPSGVATTVPAGATRAVLRGVPARTPQTISVRAVNAIGPAAPATGRVDRTAPVARVRHLRAVATSARVTVRWTATDDASGVASYDVRRCTTSSRSCARGWTWVLRDTHAQRVVVKVPAGRTVCVEVRAIDRADRTGAWSKPACTTRR